MSRSYYQRPLTPFLKSNIFALATSAAYVNLIVELFETTKKIGPNELTHHLRVLRTGENFIANPHVRFVLNEVCQAFGIPIRELLHGRGRKNDRVRARSFCCFYWHHELGYEVEKIAFGIKWHKTIIFDYLKDLRELDTRYPDHRNLLDKKNILDEKIKDYIKKNNSNERTNPDTTGDTKAV